jgi:hypothetical protein
MSVIAISQQLSALIPPIPDSNTFIVHEIQTERGSETPIFLVQLVTQTHRGTAPAANRKAIVTLRQRICSKRAIFISYPNVCELTR